SMRGARSSRRTFIPTHFVVIPGRAEGAGPESIRPASDYGFRARRTQPSLSRLRKLACAASPRNDDRNGSFGFRIIRVLFGLFGSASLAPLTAPGPALAQQELPEIRVIAPTPTPASGPTTSAAPGGPPTLVRDPGLIDRDKVPSNTQTLTPQDFEPWKAQSV